ncbi:MAG: LPS export ABC transporter ATP-binding protein [Candidatus Aminicenantes bacterium]|nr:LPS export ABC transporter ATP-binding protein [Candidatus Aminicenantes bacterium]
MPALQAKNLKKSYDGRFVVKGINVTIEPGEIIGFLGRNGAGKTTTFQMIAGLLKPNSGSVYLGDKNITRFSAPQRAHEGITYLPQESSVFLNATVKNNLRLILEFQYADPEEREKISRRLLKELGLEDLAHQKAYSLSGGERRRLEICRSLVLDPKYLFLDEPFTGIDPLTIIELQKILRTLKEKKISVIISDHNVRDTFKVVDRAYIIDDGQILIEGPPKQVAESPLAREKFLGKDFTLGDEINPYSSSGGRRKTLSPKVSPGKKKNRKK